MKVLHVLYSNQLSGAENVAADICIMFEKNLDTAYCSPNGSVATALKDREVIYFPMNSFSIRELKKVIRQFEPDLLHAHDVRATVLVSLVAGNLPWVSHLHVNNGDMSHLSAKSLLYRQAVRRADKIIAVSKSCLDDYKYKETIKEKTVVMENVLNPDRLSRLIELNDEGLAFDFVYIGRLADQKDPVRVAKVAADVLKKRPDCQFGIIGEGPMKKDMEEVFEREKVSSQVTFTGRLASPYKTLQSSKCLLMCSKYEGTPIAALEAMALSVPIVSTPVDGMKNLVITGETGVLSNENSVLVEAVCRLITDELYQVKMKRASFTRYQKVNDHQTYKHKLNSIYTDMLASRSVSARLEGEK